MRIFRCIAIPASLARLQDHFDVQVLCYLRRQDLWLESWYNQHIRWPWVKELSVSSPGEFLARREEFYWIDYAQMLQRWRDTFGMESMTVKVFERAQLNGDLLSDFFTSTRLDQTGLGKA